jgi:hypothetical protein
MVGGRTTTSALSVTTHVRGVLGCDAVLQLGRKLRRMNANKLEETPRQSSQSIPS